MKNVKLSYSSMKELLSCEQRYFHRKVAQTKPDSDYQESDSLGIGKAFHWVLEQTLHNSWGETLLNTACMENAVEAVDKQLVRVMLDKYIAFREASNIKVIKCEFQIETSMYVGFIDAIGVDETTKTWWLIDLKTTSRHDPNLIPQLAKDMQVGLYSHFVEDIERAFPTNLEGFTFGGFRYCQTVKSKATTASGLEKGVKVYEMVIPAQLINSEESWSIFSEVHDRAVALTNGESPKKNFSSCFSYFNACPYFSKCHGVEFTKGHPQIQVLTIDNLNDKDLL